MARMVGRRPGSTRGGRRGRRGRRSSSMIEWLASSRSAEAKGAAVKSWGTTEGNGTTTKTAAVSIQHVSTKNQTSVEFRVDEAGATAIGRDDGARRSLAGRSDRVFSDEVRRARVAGADREDRSGGHRRAGASRAGGSERFCCGVMWFGTVG